LQSSKIHRQAESVRERIKITKKLTRFCIGARHTRTHVSLGKDAPIPGSAKPPAFGMVIEFPEAGGHHHRYEHRAAQLIRLSTPASPNMMESCALWDSDKLNQRPN
jgi:hypothetical protein